MNKEISEQSKQINSGVSSEEFSNVVSNRDPMLIEVFSEVISEIEKSLKNLRVLAINTDFSKVNQRQNYFNNVDYLKRFYERAEGILIK